MTTVTKYKATSRIAALELDDLADAEPIRATETMPAEIAELLRPDSGIYIRSEVKPTMDFGLVQVKGPTHLWRVLDNATRGRLRTTIPGLQQQELEPGEDCGRREVADAGTKSYRPPWLDQEFLPRLAPFRLPQRETGLTDARVFLEPRAHEAELLAYPWCTVGKVQVESSAGSKSGSGVLVGPNLLLTAGHLAPWGASNWSMEFIPAYRRGDSNPRPFGSSFVERFRGYRPEGEVAAYDYVVCKLYQPLGQALGWMGTQSWADEDNYYARDYTSCGYPGSFDGRPAVEFALGLRHLGNDGPGKELETVEYASPGWAGGPLWFFAGNGPRVIGTVSGGERDGFDPRRNVHAGSHGMVDLVRYGLDNWRP